LVEAVGAAVVAAVVANLPCLKTEPELLHLEELNLLDAVFLSISLFSSWWGGQNSLWQHLNLL
jgi:hypothetical protein